jgi:hypothetical protein
MNQQKTLTELVDEAQSLLNEIVYHPDFLTLLNAGLLDDEDSPIDDASRALKSLQRAYTRMTGVKEDEDYPDWEELMDATFETVEVFGNA